jgi:hypothetical protein
MAYAQGVRAMQKLPMTDSRSWAYQAAIHGTQLAGIPSGAPWKECQHASWFFLPWHRMYLFHFESILRSLLPPADRAAFALPFWDYSNGAPGNALPPAFRARSLPDGTPNPLFVSRRNPSVNRGDPMPNLVTDSSQALAATRFTATGLGGEPGFGGPRTGFAHQGPAFGRVEAAPHGPVHVQVGGNSGLMTDPDSAALDPIFWLHHCNIDRLWEVWNIGGGRNPTVKAWLDRSFKLRNAAGAPVTMTASGVLDTVGQLDYTYESLPVNAGLGEELPAVPSKKRQPVLIGASDTPVEVTRHGATTQVAVSPLPDSTAAAVDDTRTYLNVTDIEGSQNPGVVYGVYLNLPADAPEDVRDEHLVGTVSFFGIELTDPAAVARNKDEPHGMRYSFDVTDVVNRLRSSGDWQPDQLTVTMLPAGVDESEPVAAAAAPSVRVGTFSLYQG